MEVELIELKGDNSSKGIQVQGQMITEIIGLTFAGASLVTDQPDEAGNIRCKIALYNSDESGKVFSYLLSPYNSESTVKSTLSGDLSRLVGVPIKTAKRWFSRKPGDCESVTFETSKGSVDIMWHQREPVESL